MSRRGLPDDAVALLLQQFADALDAGLGAPEAIAMIRSSSSAAVRGAALVDALAAVAEGRSSWGEALCAFPQTFAANVAELLEHGERNGQLSPTLALVAQDFEQRATLREGVWGALAWPLVIAGVLFVVAVVLMTFVVPVFKDVFTSFGGELPAPTLLLIALSDLFVDWWWLLGCLSAIAWLAFRARRRVPAAIWERWSSLLARMPVLGPYLGAAFLWRTGKLLQPVAAGALAASPVVAYLRASTGVTPFAAQSRALEIAMEGGASLPDALRSSVKGGGDLAMALEIDQRRPGQVAALKRVLLLAEDDLARRRVRLERAMVGVFYVLAGVVVGSFVLAMYLPIFRLGAVL